MPHHTRLRPLRRIAFVWGIGGLALACALAGGMTLQAQGIAAHDSRAPVDIAADRIELEDRANRVVFTGGVSVTQAGLNISAARMLINYTDAEGLEIQRITATGGVTITRGDERATGNNAIYDFNRRIITMAGDVRLRRGGDTLNGGRLVIDLQTGRSSVDGAAGSAPGAPANGRVTGTFTVPQRENQQP